MSDPRLPVMSRRDRRESIATIHAALDQRALNQAAFNVPLVGARRRESLTEALGAMQLTLPGDELQQIERAVPLNAAAGDRYAAPQMSTLDSEAKPSK